MNDENWYEIEGFSKYLVNPYECKVMNKESKHILKPRLRNGYLAIELANDYGKRVTMSTHRLFIQLLPGNGNQVNHIDGNKTNWHIDNLELVTQSKNSLHSIHVLGKKCKEYNKKPILAKNILTQETFIFDHSRDAEKILGIPRTTIIGVAKNERNCFKDWIFEYINENHIPNLEHFIDYPHNNDYMISKEGQIYSKPRNIFISQKKLGNYIGINTDKLNSKFLHRILAETFIPNPNNYHIVDHIDRNPLNNALENLRWCDAKTNAQNSNHYCPHKIPVIAIKDGEIIKIYDSIISTEADGYKKNSIKKHSKNETEYKGLLWKRIIIEEYLKYSLELQDLVHSIC